MAHAEKKPMVLSILIPSYNADCTRLMADLASQCAAHAATHPDFSYEILVGDDASSRQDLTALNRQTAESLGVRYLLMDENQGQSRLRNVLARASKGTHLLFIDSDAQVCTPDFIARYAADAPRADVICGSLRNPQPPFAENCTLRYRYEKKAEGQRPAAYRNRHPYERFTAFNAMMARSVWEQVHFEERCRHYGYEDALMGLQMQRLGISILHTDNPLIHLGIDSNASFLHKTETALQTLLTLGPPMTLHAGASRVAGKLAHWHVLGLMARIFSLCRGIMRRHLLGHHPSLTVFNLYRVGYYASLLRQTKKH